MAIPFYDDINLNSSKIINVKTPENDTDVANKVYVDNSIYNLNSNIDIKIQNEKSNLTDYIDGEISATKSLISNLSDDVDIRIIGNIVNDLITDSSEKSLSSGQGVVLNNSIKNLDSRLLMINNYANIEEETIQKRGNILGFPYSRCLIPIQIESGIEQIYDIDLSDKLSNISVVFNVNGFMVLNKTVQYINTDAIKLVIYSINSNKLQLEFREDILEELVDETLYLIIEYYEDSQYEPTEEDKDTLLDDLEVVVDDKKEGDE